MLSQVHPIAIGTAPNCKHFLDLKFDPSGQRLATTTTDGSVATWSTTEETQGQPPNVPMGMFKGHEGPVWTIDFAPASFGLICATGGFDRRVCIWKAVGATDFQIVHGDETHKSSVSSVAFSASPHAPLTQFQCMALPPNAYMGLHLASASLDGAVGVTSLTVGGSWTSQYFVAHLGGVRAVSWSTSETVVGSSVGADDASLMIPCHRLATGGIDGAVKIWKFDASLNEWGILQTIAVQSPIRSLAFQPANETVRDLIAVLTDDGSVLLYEFVAGQYGASPTWQLVTRLPQLAKKATKVSWSLDGQLLSVPSESPSSIHMIREHPDKRVWEVCN
eukprot:Protomagalhaensia_sp_Gyna_25__2804@NODE_261_length_4139_cov_1927_910488_g202_i0_p1_GENE_NODE_261_length_4139_cov_1927_910488_g202_i0NODE_261_length_4139_cov_1927_910488_g202_i0_p1_ORF_typecomplete_len334_score37_15ANAPC4_WD40/PF12894_7/0_01ANAPC4_WD40/PF12894_7/0_025ANAPC4_WD40/PF12894_7/5_1ANAPC4_WD40/PF12894_7/0_00032ANAPC4_WD40/PF12894_7/7_9e05WD40/PF00400_32/0_44WD40/PF00400_32/1_4e05WD40/PF00400_32/0_11WD40/PF00400_32/0_0004WD40/PF00400_32/1_1e02WD40/PF00400_32/3_2e02Ge1_WD40/PF16529_5/0_15